MCGEDTRFSQKELWEISFYDVLGVDLNDGSVPWGRQLGGACERLVQLDGGYLDLGPVGEGDYPVKLDFEFVRDPQEKTEVEQLHRLAREYVMCQINWILLHKAGISNDDWRGVDAAGLRDYIEQCTGKGISKRSLEEMVVLMKASLADERAHLLLVRMWDQDSLEDVVSQDMWYELPFYRKARPEEVEKVESGLLISRRLELIGAVCGSLDAPKGVYAGVYIRLTTVRR
jgi:hypothetical protein